jgi:hypothetical protein
MYAVGMTPVAESMAPVSEQVDSVKEAMRPWAARNMYLNFADTRRDPGDFWNEQAYHRLRRIKSVVDPCDRIRSNHPIPAVDKPARPATPARPARSARSGA